jgi:isochorismate hydrolase
VIVRPQLERSLLLVVDIQDKLLAAMPDAPGLIRDVGFLLDVASLLQIPTLATEQYPKGLGPTTPELARRLASPIPAKTSFSCCGADDFLGDLARQSRRDLFVVGMETHVCVLNTVLDLLQDGYNVFVPVDAVQSRFRIDHDTAIRRMERAGAVLTTVETAAFEWLGGAEHPQFKAISQLIRARMKTT